MGPPHTILRKPTRPSSAIPEEESVAFRTREQACPPSGLFDTPSEAEGVEEGDHVVDLSHLQSSAVHEEVFLEELVWVGACPVQSSRLRVRVYL